jgi:dTDP-4-dehydrorhamnose 3,5-epimerase
MLPGVKIYEIKRNVDERGFFEEIFRQERINLIEERNVDNIMQINLSKSCPGVIRAWHRHLRGQVDYIFAVDGTLRVCIYDGRDDSETKMQLNEIVLNSEKPQIIRIPGFYWHGTKCIGNKPSMTLYLVTKLYDYIKPDEERLPWNDSSIIDPRTGKQYDWNKW